MKKTARILFLLFFTVFISGCETFIYRHDPIDVSRNIPDIPPQQYKDGSIYSRDTNEDLYSSSRPHRVGDLLTIRLDEYTFAQDDSSAHTNRNTKLHDSANIAWTGSSYAASAGVKGDNDFNSKGGTHQSNKIQGDVTVTVVRVLRNGNLVVRGYKTLTLSHGIERIGVSGVVLPESINSVLNIVNSNQVADLHIAYLGSGDLNDSTQKGWFSRIYTSQAWPL